MLIEHVALSDSVVLVHDLPRANLVRGQVGTVVEELDSAHVLVEFADQWGAVYATSPVSKGQLLKLRYQAEAVT